MSGGNVNDSGTIQDVLRSSGNSTGLRWANTNLPATTVITSPYFNITTLTNTNDVPGTVEVCWNFGDSYMWIADGDLRVRIYGEVLVNGTIVQTTGVAHYNWLDSEPFNNGQQQTEMRSNGFTISDNNIVVQPTDLVVARMYVTAQAISGAGGQERIYIYNGQSVIKIFPENVRV